MPRPRDEERRKDLADRACAILAREGLGISAEQLAQALGIKRPSLLYYFPTYADILMSSLVDLLMKQTAFVSERVERESHPLRQLYIRVCATHEFHEGRGEQLLFLTQAMAASGGARVTELLRSAGAVFEAQRQQLVARIETGIREGTVHPCDPDALVAMSRAIIDGVTVQRVLGGSSSERIHALLWKAVLEPLVRDQKTSKKPGKSLS